jgi:serine protease AprX
MLRRITASLIILGLTATYLSPLALGAAPAPKKSESTPKRNAKFAPEFDSATGSSQQVRVIIQTNGRPNAAHDSAINSKGGSKGATFEAFDAMTAVVPASSVASLAARSDVAYISPDRTVKGQMAVTREATGAALAQAGLQDVPGVTGKGVGIAIIDTGISTSHPDFKKNNKSRVAVSVDFTGAGSSNANGILMGGGQDRNGHGTGVASVAAGNGSASKGYGESYVGIAPDASILDLKVLDENGSGTSSGVMAAINWAVVNQKRYNVRVINLSLGAIVPESYRTDPLCKAVERAVLAGIVVVAAAGNDGHTDEIVGYKTNGDPLYRQVFGAIHSPGSSPYAITVGASDTNGTAKRSDDGMAQFSSKGPTLIDHLVKPEIVAPGRGVVAAMSQENPYSAAQRPDRVVTSTAPGALQNAYFKYYGTSFSAPVVSGTVALMLEANKSLTPALVKAALMRSANALPSSLFHSKVTNLLTQGVGQINSAAAVEMANAFVPNADKLKAGQNVLKGNTTLASLNHTLKIGGESVAPTGRVLYSDGVLFNDRPTLTNGILMDNGIVLGDGLMLSDGILMGNGILLSDGILMGVNGILMGANGILLSDGILMGANGILMGANGILMGANGILMGVNGILMGADGILMGADGILMGADGILMGADGILMGADGILMGADGILMGADGLVIGDAL